MNVDQGRLCYIVALTCLIFTIDYILLYEKKSKIYTKMSALAICAFVWVVFTHFKIHFFYIHIRSRCILKKKMNDYDFINTNITPSNALQPTQRCDFVTVLFRTNTTDSVRFFSLLAFQLMHTKEQKKSQSLIHNLSIYINFLSHFDKFTRFGRMMCRSILYYTTSLEPAN
jgi:hypothetical protein